MANERKTTPGLGRVGPEPLSLEARVDWVADPPPAYISLRRAELVHTRRLTRLKVGVFATGIAATVTVFVLTILAGGLRPGLGLFGVFAGLNVRWLLPQVSALRHTTKQIESLDRRPALPAARVVIREH